MQRIRNSEFLRENLGVQEVISPAYSESAITSKLREIWAPLDNDGELTHVLIDYSSMSRFWYGAILNFFRSQRHRAPIKLTFAYSVGEHQDYSLKDDNNLANVVIRDIIYIPGFEGASLRSEAVGIFGLGFEWTPAVAVFERVEPDTVFAFIAEPGAFPDYGEIARARNASFIADHVKEKMFSFPLRSVDTCFRKLGEIILPFLNKANVILIPLGPKPHVLACLLLSAKFEPVSILHTVLERSQPERVRVSDPTDIVATEVLLVP